MNQFEWIVVRSNLPEDIKEVLLELAEAMEDAVTEITDEAFDNRKADIDAVIECVTDGKDNYLYLSDMRDELDNVEEQVDGIEKELIDLNEELISCHLCERVLGRGQIAGVSVEGIVCKDCSD